MTVINTNTAASITANALTKNERAMSQAMERLSTGQRINNAGDDAAGLAISSKMTSQVNGLNMAIRNANDAISMIQTVDGAASQVEAMLQRMRELAVQAASGTMTTADVSATDTEFQQLLTQINDIADDTTWNGVAVMSGASSVGDYGKFSFQVGANASQTIDVNFGDWNTNAAATAQAYVASTSANDSLGRDISAYTSSTASVILNLDLTIADVNTARATYGSVINRLEYAVDNLSNVSQNTAASRSRVLDADYAAETTELARTQIIQQAATAMLSQANQQAQSVLALLK